MNELLDIALGYFLDNGWQVVEHEERPVLRMAYEGDNGSWICYARAHELYPQFIFLSAYPDNVPAGRRSAVSELLTRANWGLNIGNFEMDFEDGEVRYKTSLDVTHDRLSRGLIESLVVANLVAMDDYLPAIAAVVAGAQTPQEAAQAVLDAAAEADDDEEFDLLL
jgi:hypothetical protein